MKGEVKKFLISEQTETQLQEGLTQLHLFVCSYRNTKNGDDQPLIDQKINQASVLWLKNSKLMSDLMSPIKAVLFEIEQRFQARSDMLLGIEKYLKEKKREDNT